MKQIVILDESKPRFFKRHRKAKNAVLWSIFFCSFFGMVGFLEGRHYVLSALCLVWIAVFTLANADKNIG